MNKKLSIIIPVFNEELTIIPLLRKVIRVKLISNIEKELVIVNDGSTDNTKELIELFISENKSFNIKFIEVNENRGKGFAVRTGIQKSYGNYILVQDADLEYDPVEYNKLLKPILDEKADVVYGSRFLNKDDYKNSYLGHKTINKGITFLSNFLSGKKLTDIQTCYKLFKTDIIKKINLCENRFSFDHEITAKLARMSSVRIKEVAISYKGRKYNEKKIGCIDGLKILWAILKYNVFINNSSRREETLVNNKLLIEINKNF